VICLENLVSNLPDSRQEKTSKNLTSNAHEGASLFLLQSLETPFCFCTIQANVFVDEVDRVAALFSAIYEDMRKRLSKVSF